MIKFNWMRYWFLCVRFSSLVWIPSWLKAKPSDGFCVNIYKLTSRKNKWDNKGLVDVEMNRNISHIEFIPLFLSWTDALICSSIAISSVYFSFIYAALSNPPLPLTSLPLFFNSFVQIPSLSYLNLHLSCSK